MTLRRILVAGAACLAMTACASLTPISEGQKLAAAWSALGAAAASVDALARSGVLHGINASTAATDLNEATEALSAATVAYQGGNNVSADQQIVAGTTLVAAIIAITQSPGN